MYIASLLEFVWIISARNSLALKRREMNVQIEIANDHLHIRFYTSL